MKTIKMACLCMALLILLQPVSAAYAFSVQRETETCHVVLTCDSNGNLS